MEHRWAQGLMLFLPALLCSQLRSMLGVLCAAGVQVVGLVACYRGWWLTHASDCRSRSFSGAPPVPSQVVVVVALYCH